MADTADFLTSKETQDAPVYDVPSTTPPPYEEQQPPPYSAATAMYPPPNIQTARTSTTGYESCSDVCPEASSAATAEIASSAFDDKTVRRAFVRKVFSILTLQLLFLLSVVCVFTFSGGETNLWAYFTSLVTFVAVAIALSGCKSLSRRHPWNLLGLVVVTLSLSYMVGTIASFHDTAAVALTLGATLAISVAIIAFSAQTYDFSVWYGVLLIQTVDLIMFVFLHLLLLVHQ